MGTKVRTSRTRFGGGEGDDPETPNVRESEDRQPREKPRVQGLSGHAKPKSGGSRRFGLLFQEGIRSLSSIPQRQSSSRPVLFRSSLSLQSFRKVRSVPHSSRSGWS